MNTEHNHPNTQHVIRTWLMMLLVLFSSAGQATSLNRFQIPHLQEPNQRIYPTGDGRLMHAAPMDETTTAVFALDLVSMQQTSLLEVPTASLLGPNFYFLELSPELMLLILPVDGGIDRLYMSRQGQRFEPYLEQSADDLTPATNHSRLFSFRIDNQVMVSNGDPASQVFIPDDYQVLCALSLDHMVLADRDGNLKAIHRYRQGAIERLLLDYHLTPQGIGDQPKLTEDACVFDVTHTATDQRSYYHHPVAGEPGFLAANVLAVPGAIENNFITLNERTSALLPRTVQLVDGQTLEVLNQHPVRAPNNAMLTNSVRVDHGRVFVFNDHSTFATELQILGSDLNPLHGPIRTSGGFRLESTAELDILAYPDRLELYRLGEPVNNIQLSQSLSWYFWYSKSQLVMKNANANGTLNGRSQYLKLDPLPAAGSAMQGPWIDTQYQNQGLSIHHGIRQDGSEYIYATLYLFRDGAPFWLAGATDVIAGQPAVDLELFEFDGANFLDTSAPERIPFGFMNLRFTACDQMQATIRYGDSETSLDLRRVDDRSFQAWCFDDHGGEHE